MDYKMPDVNVTVSDLKSIDDDAPNTWGDSTPAQKKQVRRLRHSNFYITLNTNKCFSDRKSPELLKMSEKLTQALESTLGESELPSYVQFRDPEHRWSKQWVKSVRSQSVIEVGGKKHCLHSHSLVCIAHYSNVHLKLPELKACFKNALDLENLYLNVQVYRSAHDNLERYLNKKVNSNLSKEFSKLNI